MLDAEEVRSQIRLLRTSYTTAKAREVAALKVLADLFRTYYHSPNAPDTDEEKAKALDEYAALSRVVVEERYT